MQYIEVFIIGCVLFNNAVPLVQSLCTFDNDYGLLQQNNEGNDKSGEYGLGPFVRFLVAVNATEVPCVATVLTPELQAGMKYNETEAVTVGGCDKGPLIFNMQAPPGKNMTLNLTFFSSVIEDASPPTCQITWDGHYLTPPPTQIQSGSESQRLPSLLPGCFTMDSREGWHMTYYWFYVFDWRI